MRTILVPPCAEGCARPTLLVFLVVVSGIYAPGVLLFCFVLFASRVSGIYAPGVLSSIIMLVGIYVPEHVVTYNRLVYYT